MAYRLLKHYVNLICWSMSLSIKGPCAMAGIAKFTHAYTQIHISIATLNVTSEYEPYKTSPTHSLYCVTTQLHYILLNFRVTSGYQMDTMALLLTENQADVHERVFIDYTIVLWSNIYDLYMDNEAVCEFIMNIHVHCKSENIQKLFHTDGPII